MKTINVVVEGGKATAGAPLAPALAPLGVNIGQVVAKINEVTKAYSGMKVPVAIHVDPKTKNYTVDVGSPPTAEMIKKEAGIEKGSGAKDAVAGNISSAVAAKIAKANAKSLGKDSKQKLLEIAGTCKSMGVTIDGKKPQEFMKEVNEGKHDSLLKG